MRGLTHYHVCQYSVWCAACAAEAGLTPRSKEALAEKAKTAAKESKSGDTTAGTTAKNRPAHS